MILKVVRYFNLLLVALTLGLTWCHVMEIPGKLRLSGAQWLTVQHNLYIAFGPPLGAPIEVGSIVLTWLVLLLVRTRRPAASWTFTAAICVTAGLGVWFWLVSPMNATLSHWTVETIPSSWTTVRNQWETGQAIHASLFGLGFTALVIALLTETPPSAQPSSSSHA